MGAVWTAAPASALGESDPRVGVGALCLLGLCGDRRPGACCCSGLIMSCTSASIESFSRKANLPAGAGHEGRAADPPGAGLRRCWVTGGDLVEVRGAAAAAVASAMSEAWHPSTADVPAWQLVPRLGLWALPPCSMRGGASPHALSDVIHSCRAAAARSACLAACCAVTAVGATLVGR